MFIERMLLDQKKSLAKQTIANFYPKSWEGDIELEPIPTLQSEADSGVASEQASFQIVLKDSIPLAGLCLGFVTIKDFNVSFCNNMLRYCIGDEPVSPGEFYRNGYPELCVAKNGDGYADWSPKEKAENKEAEKFYRNLMSEIFEDYDYECNKYDLKTKTSVFISKF